MLIVGIDASPWKAPPSTRMLLEGALGAAKKAIPADHTETILVRLCDYKYDHHEGSLSDGVPEGLQPVIDYMMRADDAERHDRPTPPLRIHAPAGWCLLSQQQFEADRGRLADG